MSLIQPLSLPSDPLSQRKVDAADAATGSPADTSSAGSSDTITASDFLTLLVTELKNQDPTSNQDPNAYITQLVGVNSLQQLIAINQDLTPTAASSSSSSSSSPDRATGGLEGNRAALANVLAEPDAANGASLAEETSISAPGVPH